MSAEREIYDIAATAVEGPHWAPPTAPMEMPRQVLEDPHRTNLMLWLARILRPMQTG